MLFSKCTKLKLQRVNKIYKQKSFDHFFHFTLKNFLCSIIYSKSINYRGWKMVNISFSQFFALFFAKKNEKSIIVYRRILAGMYFRPFSNIWKFEKNIHEWNRVLKDIADAIYEKDEVYQNWTVSDCHFRKLWSVQPRSFICT